MLKNRLYVFAPACVRDIITPEGTGLVNELSGLFDTLTDDTPCMSGKEEM